MLRTIVTLLMVTTTFGLPAQNYHHYWISWNANGTAYAGVMAVNTRLPTQVLRLAFYDVRLGRFRLIEQRYSLSSSDGYFYMHNRQLTDRTFCDSRPIGTYSPDQFYFIEDDYQLQMWCVDTQGVSAPVYSQFIPLGEIDDYKPYFWPERYGHCNSSYWHGLMFALFSQ